MLQKIYMTGVQDGLPPYLERKTILSNQIAIAVILIIALPFVFISGYFFPVLVPVPALGILACLGVIALNRSGLIQLSRVILSVTPVGLAAFYNAALTTTGQEPLAGIYIIELSFVFIPLIVFDLREKQYLLVSLIAALIILFTFDLSNQWIEMDLDFSSVQSRYINRLSILLGTLISISCIFVLINESRVAEKKAENLLEEARDSNQKAAASERELKENLERLKKNQEQEEQRRWAAEGIAQATRILRQSDNITQLHDTLIAFIVNYIDANQGGIFIVNEEGDHKTIDLVACYAYQRKKYLNKRIEIGEGLIGQAYLEKEYIYLTEIPEQYINITSGLGSAPPRNLLIVPLMANDAIEGVIELASFKKMEEHVIHFVNNLCDSLASTIRNNKINQKTKDLLAESQQQTEEMRAQEEEMRQNLEELSATQEEMARKQKELEKVKIELEHKQQEVEKIRASEKARAEAKIDAQKKTMNTVMEKMKEKEASFRQKIEEQEELIASLKN